MWGISVIWHENDVWFIAENPGIADQDVTIP